MTILSLLIDSIRGLGTGVLSALQTAVGSAGAFVVNGGALGTPSSGNLTSCTPLSSINGESALSANHSITSASGTYEATGLTMTLPSAGTYFLHWHGRVNLNSGATASLIAGILKNTSDSTNVSNSFALLAVNEVTGAPVQASGGASCIVTVAASKTFELYVQRNGSSFTTTDVIAAGIAGDKGTVINYFKIAN